MSTKPPLSTHQPDSPHQLSSTHQSSSRHILLSVAYEGTDFCGWQIQPNLPTIQGSVEKALAIMEKSPVSVRSSGRTDSGVHACGHPAGFITKSTIPLKGYWRGLNRLLPETISIQSVCEVPMAFDARRWHCRKTYRYTIHNSSFGNPFYERFTWRVGRKLNIEAMKHAAVHLIGTHDFNAFRAADCGRANAVRTIEAVEIEDHNDFIFIDVIGPAFLKNMVRIITGVLVDVGSGKITPSQVPALLDSKDRTLAGQTAPSKGLCLLKVFYHGLPQSMQPASCFMPFISHAIRKI